MNTRWMTTAVATVLCWAASPQARPAPLSMSGENPLDRGQQRAAGPVRFSELMTEGEVRSNIERWRVGTERLYLDEYEKKLSIRLEAEASGFLVNEYVKRNLSPVFLQNPNLSRFIIRRDLRVVMNAALVDGIRTRYQTFASFIMSASADVAITMNNLRAALASQDCNVIPCPPDKCSPDCSDNSFKRFSQ